MQLDIFFFFKVTSPFHPVKTIIYEILGRHTPRTSISDHVYHSSGAIPIQVQCRARIYSRRKSSIGDTAIYRCAFLLGI